MIQRLFLAIIYIYMYMGVSYCYLIVCWSSVLIPSPSVPAVPEPDPWAVGGEYSGVQGLGCLTSARSPPPAGFAILSALLRRVECGIKIVQNIQEKTRKMT